MALSYDNRKIVCESGPCTLDTMDGVLPGRWRSTARWVGSRWMVPGRWVESPRRSPCRCRRFSVVQNSYRVALNLSINQSINQSHTTVHGPPGFHPGLSGWAGTGKVKLGRHKRPRCC